MNRTEAAAVIADELERWTVDDVIRDPHHAASAASARIRSLPIAETVAELEDRHDRLTAITQALEILDRPDAPAEPCPHGGDVDTCPPCQRAADQGHGPAVPGRSERAARVVARYTSNCPCCGGLIVEGRDEVVRDEALERWVCATCADGLEL